MSKTPEDRTAFRVLGAVSACHFLNDALQAVIPSVYPILKDSFGLDFGQIGLITLAWQLTASVLQPAVGMITDRRPLPYSLAAGMGFSLAGVLLLSAAPSFPFVLAAVALVGVGSAVFHPESSRVARMASGGRHGLAQSVFQVGGNVGSALGPLLAALVVLPGGQRAIAWFSLAALAGIFLLARVGRWYAGRRTAGGHAAERAGPPLSRPRVAGALLVLVALVFSKYFYLASINSYYTFFLIERFGVPVRTAQLHLFVFFGAVALGALLGGPIGDRIGRRYVIWISILGVLPFTLLLPYASLAWTPVLVVIIGVVLSSAFSAIVVYAQELVPGRVGTVAGLFFGFAFGVGGVGAALLGRLADSHGIELVYRVTSLLPAIGLLTAFLPDIEPRRTRRDAAPQLPEVPGAG